MVIGHSVTKDRPQLCVKRTESVQPLDRERGSKVWVISNEQLSPFALE